MTSMPAVESMTAQEFLALPLQEHAGHVELVDGELVVGNPSWLHQRVVGQLWFALELWTRAAEGRGAASAPIDVVLDERNVYAPDLLWYEGGRVPARFDRPPYPLPLLAAEVRSPSTWRYDVGVKKATYEREGLRELWLVDTAADSVLVFRRSSAQEPAFDESLELARGDSLASPLLPGFSLSLDELFAD